MVVKSPPEVWAELRGDWLSTAVGEVTVTVSEPERLLAWRTDEASGSAELEPSSWGTKVTLTADLDDRVATNGLWSHVTGRPFTSPRHREEFEHRLTALLDELCSPRRRPFVSS